MRQTWRRLAKQGWMLAAMMLAACASEQPAPSLTWHRDVAPLMQERCGGCHVEGGIAPFALQSHAQVFERRAEIREAVSSRRMPPWQPGPGCAEYLDDLSLSEEQITLITRWVDAGAPEGSVRDARPVAPSPPVGLSRVDLELRMPLEYTPQKAPDDYRCFILDWPHERAQYITGFNGKPGTLAEIHHLIAYLIRPEEVAQVQALDNAEPGPGYTCFGGPGGKGAQVWLGAWAPGAMGGDYPERTGLEIQPGSKIVLQVHYNTHSAAPSPDRSSLQFKLDERVDTPAYMLLWTDASWVLNKTMDIPAGQADVMHRWTSEPSSVLEAVTRGAVPNGEPLTLHTAALHMHTLGTRARLEVLRQAGGTECLLDIPRWNFSWQNSYRLREPRELMPGDRLTVECHWDNSAPGAVDTHWGEGTHDEMCLGILYMTPKKTTVR
ncbi:hypothetical protein [Hyalangium minutum]|uniref:Monooxygenase n=1 Tax=Hyalangium minutum TaxID=394096 RepID=A0A085W9Q3_9BACT|nr:hypothetical protein [Hyalangium minutum]KFE64416.1 hypothetical protein DB31_2210 [Hyalangium minutum]